MTAQEAAGYAARSGRTQWVPARSGAHNGRVACHHLPAKRGGGRDVLRVRARGRELLGTVLKSQQVRIHVEAVKRQVCAP